MAASTTLTAQQRHERAVKASEASAAVRRTEKIARLIESAPPLTAEQRDRLAALLRPTT